MYNLTYNTAGGLCIVPKTEGVGSRTVLPSRRGPASGRESPAGSAGPDLLQRLIRHPEGSRSLSDADMRLHGAVKVAAAAADQSQLPRHSLIDMRLFGGIFGIPTLHSVQTGREQAFQEGEGLLV